MIRGILCLFLSASAIACAEDKGFCPPAPPVHHIARKGPPPESTPDKRYVGTVTLQTVISDKGYVCNASVIHGINDAIDKQTADSATSWRFEPATKDGKAIPVIVKIDINYWINGKGELISDPPPKTMN